MEDETTLREWVELEKERSDQEKESHKLFKTSLLQHNRSKNRYSDVLTTESTRVVLDECEYINANFIHNTNPFDKQLSYIATQGPMEHTRDDFYSMLWENEIKVIVMLTNCIEKGFVKCDKYCPDSLNESIHSENFSMTYQSNDNASSQSSTNYIIRYLQLTHLLSGIHLYTFHS